MRPVPAVSVVELHQPAPQALVTASAGNVRRRFAQPGGISAPGLGLDRQRAAQAQWSPTWLREQELDSLYAESWSLQKAVSIPVDDAFVKWRTWTAEDEAAEATMREAEDEHAVRDVLARAMKAGRLHGTGLVVMVTAEAPLDEELDPQRIRAGDLRALRVFTRWRAAVEVEDEDFASPTFGEPLIYRFVTRYGHQVDVHRSRVLRFDGLVPLGDDGAVLAWGDGRWWGRSLVPLWLEAANAEALAASASANLVFENGVALLKADGLREDIRAGGTTALAEAEELREAKTALGMLIGDSSMTLERVATPVSGVAPVLERLSVRLAAAAGIPHTRFLSESPTGWQSGASERNDYAVLVAETQERMLSEPLERLDAVLARSAGLSEPPEWEFLPLLDDEGSAQADVAMKLSGALTPWYDREVLGSADVLQVLRRAPILDQALGDDPGPEEGEFDDPELDPEDDPEADPEDDPDDDDPPEEEE